ncbi:RNA polymerase sigma factor (sigma-70 family) [Lachnospiraceae bacterium PM6-15]|uniref:sigma-70 family RNA polymerase sigma factor n=1 Tax=Ohessyouella blattaphilus TaxID=2949333 RepID=UPI003E27D7A8
MSNEELVRDIQAGASDKMLLLWKQCEKFIVMIANKYKGLAEIEDLTQEGYFALCQAVEKYDETKEATFIHYLAIWLKQTYSRYIMNNGHNIRVPVHAYTLVLKYQSEEKAFKREYGREPSNHEMAKALAISVKQVMQLKKDMVALRQQSLDEVIPGLDGGVTLGDSIADTGDDIELATQERDRQQLREEVSELLEVLPIQQQDVIKARYMKCKTLAETGEQIGVTIERVRVVQQKALNTLRLKKHSDKLRPYYDDYLAAHAYRHIGVAAFQRNGISSTEYAAFRLMD